MTSSNGATTVRASPELALYQRQQALWLSGESDDLQTLEDTGTALCELARTHAVRPEELIVAIRGGQAAPVAGAGTDKMARLSQAREHRYTLAINLLMKCYYA